MEAIGEHLEEVGGLAALLSRADSLPPATRPGARAHSVPPRTKVRTSSSASGAEALPVRHSHLQAVPAVSTPPPAVSEMLPAPADVETNQFSALGLSGLGDRLNAVAMEAADALREANYAAVAQFAGQVEELARTVEHIQLLSAGAVDRTRKEAIADAEAARSSRSRSWVTGWNNGVETLNETDADWPATAICSEGNGAAEPVENGPAGNEARSTSQAVTSPADDGCRNTAEFLRLRLRIPLREARRRLALAHQTLPGTSLTGEPLPPARPHLATALTPAPGPAAGTGTGTETDEGAPGTETGEDLGTQKARGSAPVVSSYTGTLIATALDRLQRFTTPEALDLIEKDLTTAAVSADPDFLARLVQRWTEAIDADGTEPSEEALRHTQGAFLRKPRHGLHHLEIFATTEQYEHLLTAMNAATNPRTTTGSTGKATYTGANISPGTATTMGAEIAEEPGICSANGAELRGHGTSQGAVWNATHPEAHSDTGPDLERRTRPQRQLDGIIGTVKAGLTTDTLPTTGGNRPQIIATINYRDLFPHLPTGPADPGTGEGAGTGTNSAVGEGSRALSGRENSSGTRKLSETGSGSRAGQLSGTGNFAFTGPVAAENLRKIACDADIIPALLGTHGEILDLGRKTRLFTPAQRLALIARDQGCTFPNCTIPAPWCEAHHITYWSHGGPTNLENGALLCAHHHHLIHKEQWTITTAMARPGSHPRRTSTPTKNPNKTDTSPRPRPRRCPGIEGPKSAAALVRAMFLEGKVRERSKRCCRQQHQHLHCQ